MNRTKHHHAIPGRRRLIAQAVTTILILQSLGGSVVLASPQGGQVVAGSGSINYQDAATTIINQQSGSLVIDWRSFNLATDELVRFVQPSSDAAALNRIYDQNPSQIFGTLQANGQIFLMNPNGIIFGEGSRLEVNGLVATTLMMESEEFMQRLYNMRAIDGNGGLIVNRGLIQAATGGVTLVGSGVVNEGTILANLGSVNLASGTTATVDFDGDHLINFAVSGEVAQNAAALDAAVSNSGAITAVGGDVLLTAHTARSVFDNAINNSGVIKASRVVDAGGVIRLEGPGGTVTNSGTLDVGSESGPAGAALIAAENIINSGVIDATARNGDGGQIDLRATDTALVTGSGSLQAMALADGAGGTIRLLGDRVGLFDQARVDASGASGGGEIRIGGDFFGADTLPASALTYLGSGVSLRADALNEGEGGNVAVWSDGTTINHATISAQGGAAAGNGGFVEVSGKETLMFDGQVDTRAAHGATGTLLLDPTDIFVVASGSNTTALTDVDEFADADKGTGSTSIDVASINTAASNVVLQATQDIAFNTAVNITTAGVGLTAQAGRDISVASGNTITTNGGDVAFTADANTGFAGSQDGTGSVTVNAAINTSGGDVTLTGVNVTSSTSGTLTTTSSTDSTNGNPSGAVVITASNGITLAGAITTSGRNSNTNGSAGGDGGAVTITATGGVVSVQDINANGGSGKGTGGNSSNGGDAGTIELTAENGNVTANAALVAAGGAASGTATNGADGTVNIAATGNITTNGINVDTGDFTAILSDGATLGTLRLSGAVTAGSSTLEGMDDTLFLDNATTNTFTISSADGGTIGADITFIDFANLTGGSGDDTFTFAAGGSLSGTIDGGAHGVNGDTVDYSARSDALAVTLGSTITNIETLTGNNVAGSTLSGTGAGDSFTINGADAGSVAGVSFSQFTDLAGGSGDDTFTFADGGSLSGTIDGGAHGLNGDTVDYAARTDVLAVTLGSAFANVETIIGNNIAGSTLSGTGAGDTFTIDGADAGSVAGVSFSQFTDLAGDGGDDTFTFADGGSLSGTIDGGAHGVNGDTVDYSARSDVLTVTLGSTITNVETVTGNNVAGSTLSGTGAGDIFTIDSTDAGSVAGVNFSQFTDLAGGSGNDTFAFAGGSVSGGVSGGAGSDTLDYSGATGAYTVNLQTSTASLVTNGLSGIEAVAGSGDETLIGFDAASSFTLSGSNSGSVNGSIGFTGVANLTGGSGDDTFTFTTSTVALTGTLNGGLGSNTLVAGNITNTFTINGVDSGSLNGATNFTNIANLTGGSGNDTFAFAGGSASGTVSGGSGSDTLDYSGATGAYSVNLQTSAASLVTNGFSGIEAVAGSGDETLIGFDAASSFTLSGSNSGSVNGSFGFTGVANLTGGSGNDTFTFTTGTAALTGTLNGGLGSNTLVAGNITNTFTLNGVDSGSLNGTTNFTNIANLTGGSGNDTFAFAGGSVSGGVSGGSGSDTLDYSGVTGAYSVNLQTSAASLVTNGFSGIEAVAGSGDETLIGFDAASSFTLSGSNSGSVNGSFGFTGVANLTGGSGDDTFTFTTGTAALTGTLNGGLGSNTLVAGNITNTFGISGANSGTLNSTSFTNIANLTGGSGNDTFAFTGGSVSGTVSGGSGSDTLDYSGVTGAYSVNLQTGAASLIKGGASGGFASIEAVTGSGDETLTGSDAGSVFTLSGGGSGAVGTIAFSGVNNFVGGSGNDSFTLSGNFTDLSIAGGAGADALTLAGDVNGSGIVTLDLGSVDSATDTMDSGTHRLAAATLALNGIERAGSASDPFNIAAGTLNISNSGTGDFYLDQSGALILRDMSVGSLALFASGNLEVRGSVSAVHEIALGSGGTLSVTNSDATATQSVLVYDDGVDRVYEYTTTYTQGGSLHSTNGNIALAANNIVLQTATGPYYTGYFDLSSPNVYGGTDYVNYWEDHPAAFVDAASGSVTLTTFDAAQTIGVGTMLTAAELALVTASQGLTIGDASHTGGISIGTDLTRSGALSLVTAGAISESAGYTVAADALSLTAGTGIGSSVNPFSVDTGALSVNNTLSGDVYLHNANTLSTTLNGLTNSATGGVISYTSAGALLQGTGSVTAADITLNANGVGTSAVALAVNGAAVNFSSASSAYLDNSASTASLTGNAAGPVGYTQSSGDVTLSTLSSGDAVTIDANSINGGMISAVTGISLSGANGIGSNQQVAISAPSLQLATDSGDINVKSNAVSTTLSGVSTGANAQAVQLSGNSLSLNGNVGDSADSVTITTTGSLNQTAGSLAAGQLALTAGGAVTLNGATNDVGVLTASLSGAGEALSVNDANGITLGTISTNNGAVTVTAGGTISVQGNMAGNSANVSLATTSGTIDGTGGTLDTTGMVTLAAADGIGSNGTVTTTSAQLTLTTSAATGNIDVATTASGVATSNVAVTTDSSAQTIKLAAGSWTIDSAFGNVTDDLLLLSTSGMSNAGGTLTANELTLGYGGNVGSSAAYLNIDTALLNIQSSGGSGWLNNSGTQGNLTIASAVNSGSGDLAVTQSAGNLLVDLLTLAAGSASLDASAGNIDELGSGDADVDIAADTINLNAAGAIGAVSPLELSAQDSVLTSNGGGVAAHLTGGSVSASAVDAINLASSGGLTLGTLASSNSGDISATAAGSVSQAGNITTGSGNITVTAGGGINMQAGTLSATNGGTISYSTGGNIVLSELDAAQGSDANVGLINVTSTSGGLTSAVLNTPNVRANNINIDVLGGIGSDPVNTFNLSSDIQGQVFLRYAGVAYIATAPQFNVELNILDAGGNLVNAGAARSAASQRGQSAGLEEIGYVDAAVFTDITLFGINGVGTRLPPDQSEDEAEYDDKKRGIMNAVN